MSRFGWAYVSDVITGSGGTPGGSDKAIQFASGSTFSGSTNFTFDYGTNTVRLTGTLYADNLIVSSSQILKSGSTIFGDDAADTHQFTGSVFTNNNLTVIGQVSASVAINTAGTIQAGSNITSNGIVSSSNGFSTAATVTAAGVISSSAEIKSNSSITASNNIISTAGFVSASNGLYSGNGLTVTGSSVLRSGLTVTGSSFVQALSSSGQIQATSFAGNGLNITGIQATNVDGAGDDWSIQFKNGNTGTLTGSSNLLFSGSTLILTGTLSGTTAQFTTITGSTALLTSGAIVTGSVYVNNGSVVARGLPSLESFMPKRSIQLFPLNNLMCSTMFSSTANTPFTENFATKAQNFDSNGRPFMTYTTAVSSGTAGFTTTDIGTTKVLCRSIANPNWRGFFKTGSDITTQRIFIGFEPYSASSRSADDPNFGYAFIQYSSVRGDTEFKLISKTQAAGTQVTASTGINITANTNYFFDMVLASGSFTVTLTSGSTTTTTALTSSLLHETASVGVCSVMMPSAANSRDFSIYMLEFNDT